MPRRTSSQPARFTGIFALRKFICGGISPAGQCRPETRLDLYTLRPGSLSAFHPSDVYRVVIAIPPL